jgi:SagB-type dehydrogenase family enzyme
VTGLTIRISAERVIASDDEGRTAYLPGELGVIMRDAFERAGPEPAGSRPTAAALAGIAEARIARPLPATTAAPAWQDDRDGTRVSLAVGRESDSRRLADVLVARRSQRAWSAPDLEAVGTVLVRSGRVIGWSSSPDGYVATHRPVPSAGARHPMDLHLLAGDVDGLAAGAWRFDALRCDLVATGLPYERVLARLGEVLGTETPPAALVAVAHLPRTLSRYPSGLSLLWRDAGALLATLQLCATDVGLASCISGTCGVLVDEPELGTIDVGGLVLGNGRRG